MKYSEKLKDPRWQKKRLEIFERDNFACQLCGDSESTLVVHHFKYEGEPWEIDNKYLITYCESCHESEHIDKKLYLSKINKYLELYNSGELMNIECILFHVEDSKYSRLDTLNAICCNDFDEQTKQMLEIVNGDKVK
jgi:5-methylcytosine-specific restriction endonuclease McrA